MYIAQNASQFAHCSLKRLLLHLRGFLATTRAVQKGYLNPLVQLTQFFSAAWEKTIFSNLKVVLRNPHKTAQAVSGPNRTAQAAAGNSRKTAQASSDYLFVLHKQMQGTREKLQKRTDRRKDGQ
jgi:hypothetical protein